MKTFLVMGNAVVYNKGSEALVRGVSYICKNFAENAYVIVSSSEPNFSADINLPYVDEYVKKYSFKSKKSPKSIVAAVFAKILRMNKIATKIRYDGLLKAAKKADFIIITAGDDFDIRPDINFDGNRKLYQRLKEQNNAKIVIYGCSMSAENINDSIVRCFNEADIVTARDSISLKNLTDAGVKDVKYYPDPALVIEKEECPLPQGWKEGKMFGLNLSNLILRSKYGGDKEKVLKSYHTLINYIINETDMNVVLIPHVMNNADMSVLSLLYEKYKDSDRVLLVENERLGASELKYIISKCEVYVGARTHSTIAAYSTCVPTLVIGYSVKSKGLATDIFGTDKNYVIPIHTIDNDNVVVEGAKWLIENKDAIRSRLEKTMPDYIEKAKSAAELLR
ncbi:MAG: polysaccharide pyruvyl transferase family protein [Bacillota bacterium]|nr:polysaccharide pyruvyl transferase family protein [Bacillota bacterium]